MFRVCCYTAYASVWGKTFCAEKAGERVLLEDGAEENAIFVVRGRASITRRGVEVSAVYISAVPNIMPYPLVRDPIQCGEKYFVHDPVPCAPTFCLFCWRKVGVLGAGSCFGATAALHSGRQREAVTCVTDCEMYTIEGKMLRHLARYGTVRWRCGGGAVRWRCGAAWSGIGWGRVGWDGMG